MRYKEERAGGVIFVDYKARVVDFEGAFGMKVRFVDCDDAAEEWLLLCLASLRSTTRCGCSHHTRDAGRYRAHAPH